MALPALHALARRGTLTIHAPRWGPDLYAEVPAHVRPIGRIRADLAVLFAPSFRAAWEARSVAKVVGTPTDWRRSLLSVAVPPGVHVQHTYAALAEAAGAQPDGRPTYGVRGQPVAVPAGHIGLNPLSMGGATREWRGYTELAHRLQQPVVFYAGPGEADRLAPLASGFQSVVGTSLPDFAATLEDCAVFVSNDSGAAHFARACGVPTVVVHGSTTASRTGPMGAVALERPLACHPCYRPTCTERFGCLDTTVHTVQQAVLQCLS